MWTAFRGVVLASIAVFLVFTLFDVHRVSVPRGIWFIDLLLCMAFVAGSRLLARTLIERPLPGRIVTRGKEAIIVGAGDAGQLVVKEMQRSPALGYTPIGTAGRRSPEAQPATPRRPGPRHDLRPRARSPRPPPGRGAHRDPDRLRRAESAHLRDRPRPRRARQDAAEPLRPRLGRRAPRPPAAPRRGRGRARARARGGGLRVHLRLPEGRGRHRDGCRRLDRLGALPPDRARRAGQARAPRPRGARPVRDRARARPGARVPGGCGRRRRRTRPRQAPSGLRQVPARGRLPRRRVQARGDDGGQPARGGAEQHAGHPRGRGRRRRVRGEALRARLDRQGRESRRP